VCGAWPSGSQAWYRGPNYWQPGTTISVRAALAGVRLGDGRYGDQDRTATVTVGSKVFLEVDNATKQMKAYVNDQLARTMPVSLGKPSTPSASGYMVLMSHDPSTDLRHHGRGAWRLPGERQLGDAPDLGRRVHPRRTVVGRRPGS